MSSLPQVLQEREIILRDGLRTQPCQTCGSPMGDMPGTRDAHCQNCGYKDPCCE